MRDINSMNMTQNNIQLNDLEKMVDAAIKDLATYGLWDTKTKCKRFIKKNLLRKAVTPEDVFFWPTGLLADGLWHVREQLVQHLTEQDCHQEKQMLSRIDSALKQYYERWINRGMPVYFLDDLLSGEVLLSMYETGEVLPKDVCRKAVDRLADFAKHYPLDENGSFLYRANQKTGEVFVDGIGLVCPFLFRYGKMFEEKSYQELAVKQIENYFTFGMDEKSGLPYHGYDRIKNYKCGIIGWGRAAGWLLRGTVACMDDPVYRDRLQESFLKIMDASLACVRGDGSFGWQLSALEGPKDTSAMGMIGVALAQAMHSGVGCKDTYMTALQAIRYSLLASVRDGRVYDCSGECEGFSRYPQNYGNYPWAQGPALHLFTIQ